jgi:hypothetical protein
MRSHEMIVNSLHDRRYQVILGLEWLDAVNPDIDWPAREWRFRDSLTQVTGLRTIGRGTPEEVEALANCFAAIHISFGDGPQLRTDPDVQRFELVHVGAVCTVEEAPSSPWGGLRPRWWTEEDEKFFDEDAADGLPPEGRRTHAIDLKGEPPKHSRIYPLHARELEVLKKYIEKALDRGWIRRSHSPMGAPVLFVPKKGGELRLCIDYRALNKETVFDRTPIPLIENIIERLAGATDFTKLDLKNAYGRVRIRKGDEWKTAFRCRYGHFEYLVMPFGLTNAPATFQRYIEEVLSDFVDVCCIVYLDDVLIYSSSKEEHEVHVKAIVKALVEAGLYGNVNKCEFEKEEVTFLGYVVTPEAVQMEPERIRAIQEWPEPKSVFDISSFLGFCGFYRRFIRNYSKITAPLTHLTRTLSDEPEDRE